MEKGSKKERKVGEKMREGRVFVIQEFFFIRQKTAYEILCGFVGSEINIRENRRTARSD